MATMIVALGPASVWALPPGGFVNEGVVAGLDEPTDLAFLPDGRLLVVSKPGQIWILDPSPVTTP